MVSKVVLTITRNRLAMLPLYNTPKNAHHSCKYAQNNNKILNQKYIYMNTKYSITSAQKTKQKILRRLQMRRRKCLFTTIVNLITSSIESIEQNTVVNYFWCACRTWYLKINYCIKLVTLFTLMTNLKRICYGNLRNLFFNYKNWCINFYECICWANYAHHYSN